MFNHKGGLPMSLRTVPIIAVTFICALATPAGAQPLVRKDLSLAMALTIATTASEAARP